MNPYYQFQQYEFEFHDLEFSNNDCFIYGIWSKYNPLSIISQVGNIGLFESTCFHLHNIIDKSSQSLNLIYYDCIDYNSQIIKKTLKFVNEDNILYQFEITIEPLQYENIWYYLQIIEFPAQLKFEFLIFSEGMIRIQEIKQMQRPFVDTNVILRFGGDFFVTNSKISFVNIETKFSYFPGFIMIQKLSKQTLKFDIDLIKIAQSTIESYGQCFCYRNSNFQIDNSQLVWLDKKIYISKNTNCDSFILSGWLNIKNIISITDEFIYKFISLSANFENSFSNKNLSPFQMSYQISPEGNKILLTTYTYNFPIVSINFQDDPFLLSKEFIIINSLTLWHNIFVNLQENLLKVFIKFYEGDMVYEYNVQFNVIQFHCIQFKLQYGNIVQSTNDYLNIEVQNLVFLNCNEQFQYQNCHFSCKDCDGPTMYNCLSCESQRIFIPEQKVCVCPYNSVDEQTCQTYLDSDFRLIEGDQQQLNLCQYGYFEYQGDCFKCPSIMRENVLNCLECLNNPKEWQKKPFCMNDLYFDNDGGTQQEIYQPTPYFFLDGTEVTLCIFCQHTTFTSLEDQYLDFLYKNLNFKSFCQPFDNNYYFQCYECQLPFCNICYLSIQGHQCLKCIYSKVLINGQCIDLNEIDQYLICRSPSYITLKKKCQLCPISNCKYCFEYQTNDLTKSTLYKNFEKFDEGEEYKIGCALCDENFIFNFNTGRCIYRKSKITNCLRSFINLDNNEVCTLSQIDNFTIAPEIANCQKYLFNCLQCLLSPESTLKCIICQEGYTSSIINGDCYKNEFKDSKIVIEGDLFLRDGWVQRIQSFMMQFLPNKYYYPKTDQNYYIREMIVECHQGYRDVGSSICEKYCDSSCIQCKTNQDGPYCAKCPLNYYQQPIRDQQKGQCSECSQLCQICQSRTQEEIYNIQPSYVFDGTNQLFTKKCLRPIKNPNILYDPYLQITKYCFESNCLNQIYYEVKFTYCGGAMVFWPFGFDYGININYCNQMGIDTMTIIFQFQIDSEQCGLRFRLAPSNLLKSKIFSLRNIYFKLMSVQRLIIYFFHSIEISNFDKIELNHVTFRFDESQMFIIQNNNSQVDIKLIDFSLELCNLQNIQSLFHNQIFGNVEAQNFQLLDSNIFNSSLINLQAFKQNGLIIIKTLFILRCVFKDANLLQFGNSNFNIQISNLIIEQCEFYNSTLLMFYDNLRDLTFLTIHNLTIQNSLFNQSSLIKNAHLVQLNIINLQIIKNNLYYSNIISFNYYLNLNISLIKLNYFQESQVLKWVQTVSEQQVNIKINDVFIIYNSFKDSCLFLLYSNQLNNIYLDISNIHLEENYILSNIDNEIALFIVQCHLLNIKDAKFINNNDLSIFQIYSTFSIQIQNILYENNIQTFKVPLSLNCNNLMNWKNQLIGIIGFFDIQIVNIQVMKQFNVDSSFIFISSSQEFQEQKIGIILIQNLIFKENLQISKQQVNLMSLLTIDAENELRIHIINVHFIENFVHSYVDSTLKYAASLMLINTQTSSLTITNMQSKNNGFTNSTNSFLNIKSYKIIITNLTINNHNLLNQEIWQKYYDIDNHLNQVNLSSLIIQVLKIQNIGGVFQITSSQIYCYNCNFTNILAQRSSILQINTIKEGQIKLDQISISQVSNNNISLITNSSGCISINSQNSLLNLEITNTLFQNIINKMAASIFTIFPSQIQNKIQLQNIKILNCISLMNQILYLQFSPQNIQNNFLILYNLTIIQNEEQWMQYLSNIIPFRESEIAEITGQTNALIYVENCQIFINKFIIEGLYISPIMKFINVIKLLLFNTYLYNIQLFYPFNIIEVHQNLGIKNIMSFKQVHIFRCQLLNTSKSISKFPLQNYQIKDCKLFLELPINNQILFNISSIQNQFFNFSQESLSIIQINSISDENQIIFQQIQINQIDCSYCNNGLIYFRIDNINQLKLQDVSCIQNYIISYGCLLFTQKNQLNVNINILNSYFYNNKGSIGVGITALNSSLILTQCKILRNQATTYGGGLYLDLNQNSFIFNQSIILNNYAKYGGGIYLNGENNLNKQNFRQTILLFNKAQNSGDNLIESPTHFALYINQIEMQSQILQINGTQKSILKIDPYFIIEQEKQLSAEYLMLPSGQQIKAYEIIIPKSLKTLFYIFEIGLYLKNSRNEQLLGLNLINSTCNISSVIQLNDGNVWESSYKTTIDFDLHKNNFDLSFLSVIFDPYDQKGKYMQICATCKVGYKTLYYLLNIKSLKCQLGEFYINQGCQKCIASQGFYSVTYDTIKCSIFDKSKFSQITSNQINLLEGFWRPHYLSDYTSFCYKNSKLCTGGWKYGNDLCSVGHIGALCEECDLQNIMGNGKYYKNQYHLECLICLDQINSFASFILVLLWAISSILLTLKSTEKSNLMFKKLKFKERFNKILFKLSQDHESILMKMLLNYLWIFSLIFNFNLQFSISFNFIDSASNTSYFMVNNLDCYLSNIYNIEMIYSKIFTMFIFIFLQFLLIISGFMIYLSLVKQQFNSSIISNTLLILYIFNYAGLIKMLCSIISNRWISNVNYVQGDVSIIFGNESHLKWMFYFVIPILILFGCLTPLSLFLIMYFKRKQLDSLKLRRHLCYLFNEYNDDSYFWEQIKLVQKVIMILVSTQFETELSIKAYLFGICLLSYQCLTIKFRPYITSRLNHLDLYSGQICSMSIFIAAIKYFSDQVNNLILSGILQIIILILCVKLCLPFIQSILYLNYKKNKIPLLHNIQKLLEKLRLKHPLKCLNNYISKENEKQQKLKDNYLKLKVHLFSTSKALLTNRKNLLSHTIMSSINEGRLFRVSENFELHQCFQTEPN
ncbi:unnamed protein product [Paramecium primaurelia]|uniref:Laminin EGF-like domain-containing protein n=1 Tax=Paramecium primaurelia TaxID=5886 RepID=A0A8S1LRY1_PARPR|nr:unnamed protein product [Paramecium primaurelia]